MGLCLCGLFTACKPDFNLNAPYKDVPVVYGILNYQDSINYVKIYKGFQAKDGSAFIDAQNPDSIYYYNDIIVVLEEYDANDKRTTRPDIPLNFTHDFPRDSGIFYYDAERIIYFTLETIKKEMSYNIKITNKHNKNITQGKTLIVNDFWIANNSSMMNLVSPTASITFTAAPNAAENGYEIHVNFKYFEVDIQTKQVLKIDKITKNICPHVGEIFSVNKQNELYKVFTSTFYEDIATHVKPNPNVFRYAGTPTSSACIEVEGWAVGDALFNFLLSNKPTSSFIQINDTYTNLTASEGMVYGFFSSRVRSPKRELGITRASEDSLVLGSKTRHLNFRPWIEYKP